LSQPTRILIALIIGIAAGIASAAAGGWTEQAIGILEPIGSMWLNALRMTIVPLVVALLITGIAKAAAAARANQLAGRALLLFVSILWISAITAALLTPLFLGLFPLPGESAAALRDALTQSEAVGAAPSFGDFLKSLVPSNAIAAAAEDAILPLILFTLLFAFAVTRLPEEPRERLVSFFEAVGDAMLVMIGWVLWIAPVGIFALAYVVGARGGGDAFGALAHYVLIVIAVGVVIWLAAWPLALVGARISLGRFTKAIAAAQAVAASTQSSVASLPAMLKAAERLDVPVTAAGVTLPMAVAVFRATGPAMNLAVAIYIAHLMGTEITLPMMLMGIAAAATTTMGAAGIPGQASFVTSIAPICFAMGLPIEPLAILIAVEVLPDIVRTLGNVSMDVAASATASRRSGFTAEEAHGEQDRLLGDDGPSPSVTKAAATPERPQP
jgi:proton glutamate symport protein